MWRQRRVVQRYAPNLLWHKILVPIHLWQRLTALR
jgi:hypothetical protein